MRNSSCSGERDEVSQAVANSTEGLGSKKLKKFFFILVC